MQHKCTIYVKVESEYLPCPGPEKPDHQSLRGLLQGHTTGASPPRQQGVAGDGLPESCDFSLPARGGEVMARPPLLWLFLQ